MDDNTNAHRFDVPTAMATLRLFVNGKKRAEAELRRVLKEDGDIVDNMRDYWKHQNSGAESC